MDEDHKELVKRLREEADHQHDLAHDCDCAPEATANWAAMLDIRSAALALEALAGEIERLTTNGIHTCHDQCQRPLCKSYREIVAATKHAELLNKMLSEAEAERDRLKAALEEIRDRHIPDQPAAVGRSREEWAVTCHTSLRIIARKALGGER